MAENLLPGRPVVIVGMHRSGTSCLAGCLQEAGLFLGAVNTAAPHNAKGNREKRAIMDLNDKVLAASGGTWRTPPGHVFWPDDLKQKAREILGSLAKPTPWGFKDPRTLLNIEGWLEILGATDVAASFRHPLAVARSLHKRDHSLSVAEGLELWQAYNERLIAMAVSRRPVHIICYDLPREAYAEAVVRTAEELGLPQPASATRFYDKTLRHQSATEDGALPAKVAMTYAQLKELAA